YRRFYMHRTSHWLGRDVHDVGRYGIDGAPRPLAPGMVFTVEPGLYVAGDGDVPEAFRGIGIRIEDDVLVTATGHELLSAAAPKTVAEIEALRAAAGGSAWQGPSPACASSSSASGSPARRRGAGAAAGGAGASTTGPRPPPPSPGPSTT